MLLIMALAEEETPSLGVGSHCKPGVVMTLPVPLAPLWLSAHFPVPSPKQESFWEEFLQVLDSFLSR
ncbi:rCG63206 [Rattus norvegicus]|uniref:RCG63206 n=1 Tax=Rattus norvegicus TaxID=10116 RepID=A6IBG7_RAT|nr:rCG63206 [Rattus norvegicus]